MNTEYQELNAGDMAELLASMATRRSKTVSTGSLSNLNEALSDWALQYIQLESAREAFDNAYHAIHSNRGAGAATWEPLWSAAADFAQGLQRLDGSTKVKRCQAPAVYGGTCGGALFPSGGCPFTPRHR